MWEGIGRVLPDCIKESTVSYDSILNLDDLRREVTEKFSEIKFDSLLFLQLAEIITFKNGGYKTRR